MRNNLIFDGYDLGHLLHIEGKPRRPLMADNEISVEDFGGHDGSSFQGSNLGSFEIEIDVRLFSKDTERNKSHISLEDLRRKIAGLLHKDKPCKLVIPTAPDVYYLAMLDGSTDLDHLSYTSSTTLIFRVFEPAGFGATHKRISEGGMLSIMVDGTYKTKPIIFVEVDEPFVMDIDGSAFMVLGSPSGACRIGDNKVLDATGARIRYSIFNDMPEWEPGNHRIYCNYPFEVEWTERWL